MGATQSDAELSFVLEQGDRCVELIPLSGEDPVEEFYDYRYPTELWDSVSGSNDSSYSSHGTTHLQKDNTSILFLYDGPEGLSLVVVHGRLDGEEDNGGIVTFTLDGMPDDASWVVRDDYYTVDGEQAPTNHDNWDVDGSTHQIDWGYRFDRTDGGAVRGLGDEFEISIDPAFNDDAVLAADLSYGPIEAWEALSATGDSPERVSLQMDAPVTIRSGTCETSTPDEPTDTPEEQPTDTPEEQPTDTPEEQPTDTPTDEPTDTPDDTDGGKDKDDEERVC